MVDDFIVAVGPNVNQLEINNYLASVYDSKDNTIKTC